MTNARNTNRYRVSNRLGSYFFINAMTAEAAAKRASEVYELPCRHWSELKVEKVS